jgi:hypothetical protein
VVTSNGKARSDQLRLTPHRLFGRHAYRVVNGEVHHASASTTLNVYGHIWPDKDESARAAVQVVIADRLGARADSMRTEAR